MSLFLWLFTFPLDLILPQIVSTWGLTKASTKHFRKLCSVFIQFSEGWEGSLSSFQENLRWHRTERTSHVHSKNQTHGQSRSYCVAGGSNGKKSTRNAGHLSSVSELGRSSGGGLATQVAKSRTRLSDFTKSLRHLRDVWDQNPDLRILFKIHEDWRFLSKLRKHLNVPKILV